MPILLGLKQDFGKSNRIRHLYAAPDFLHLSSQNHFEIRAESGKNFVLKFSKCSQCNQDFILYPIKFLQKHKHTIFSCLLYTFTLLPLKYFCFCSRENSETKFTSCVKKLRTSHLEAKSAVQCMQLCKSSENALYEKLKIKFLSITNQLLKMQNGENVQTNLKFKTRKPIC